MPRAARAAAAAVCGDGVLESPETCDDGNSCALDGCRAPQFQPVPTVVLADLALDPAVAFDLDDADGDHHPATGGDNRLGRSGLVTSVVNPLITQSLEDADVIQLVTFGDLGNAYVDPAVTLSLYPGVSPSCPAPTPAPGRRPSTTSPGSPGTGSARPAAPASSSAGARPPRAHCSASAAT